MNNLDKEIVKFKSFSLDKYKKVYKEAETKRLKFIQLFPKNQLMKMQIDDYVVGKGSESFCYWMETKLKELGSIKGGAPADKKFGLYYSKDLGEYVTISKWDIDLNISIAFKNIKNEIIDLLNVGEKSDIESISNNKLSPMFKNKILVTYYPDKYLNIFSPDHVKYFVNKLNIESSFTSNIEEKRQLLIKYKNNNKELKEFNNYIFMRFLYSWNNPKFKEIRILPMNVEEFPNMGIEEIQIEFFQNKLIYEQKGKYRFKKRGMNASKGALILFQIQNKLIASANLLNVEKYEKEKDGYGGEYCFDINSIRVFEAITPEEIAKIDKKIKRLSNSKQRLDISNQDEILYLINSKEQMSIPEEIIEDKLNKFTEGSKKKILVNSYERNSKARAECIRLYGTKCIICGFDFGKIYGEIFDGKVHIHHKVPLNEIDNEYEVNPETDLVPVCPNCHLVLHSKTGGTYSIEEVKNFIKSNKI